jgi:hypothetical protein
LSHPDPEEPPALTNLILSQLNDPYDVNDPLTPAAKQRQQQRLPQQLVQGTQSTQSSSSARTLRRTSRLEFQAPSQPRRTHIEAASVGITPSPSPPRVRFAEQHSGQSEYQQVPFDLTDDLDSTTTKRDTSPGDKRHPAVRVSKRTASAILYALEIALRQPNPFTPDLLEENASMSDPTGGGPSAAAGNGRIGNNGASRMQQGAPAPTGSPSGRIRAPTDIWRDRVERERRKAEREAIERAERAKAEGEANLLEQDRRRRADKRAAAGVAEGRQSGGGDFGSTQAPGQRTSDDSQKSDRLGGGNTGSGRPQDAPIQGRGRGGTAMGGGDAVPGAAGRVRPTVSQGQPRPVQNAQNSQGPGASQTQAGPSALPPSAQPAQESSGESAGPQNTTRRTTQSSFPHAFERWETLSSHWEGLTSFWIRRLEENANEIQRDPVSAQLSRQVTDLSAAGANLFHAVVELQRLRASSERKFQRWFFETRAEQERAQEVQAMLDAALQEERRGRAEAIADAVARAKERSNSDKLVAEMKRELQISKEEARRAWEELGRREQEERERTMSLREGHPTLVGGVQVVPMMAGGAPSRNASVANRPQTREGAYAGSPEAGAVGDPTMSDYQQATRAQRGTDPFVENSRTSAPSSSLGRADASSQQTSATSKSGIPQYSQAPAVQPPTTSATFYQQRHGTNLLPTDDQRSDATSYSDTEYDIDPSGQIRRDSRGNKIRYSDPHSDDGSDEMDVAAERERELAHLRQYGHAPVSGVEYVPGTSSAPVAGPSSRPDIGYEGGQGAVDYSGQGYGADPWVSFPRHYHPTRLSDVLEEDERSRTSAGPVSRPE